MIEVYKIVHGHYLNNEILSFHSGAATRGHVYKLDHGSYMHDMRKYCFSSRVVSLWDSLHNSVVTASKINTFKNRLDKFWFNQDRPIYFNWESEFTTGTGVEISNLEFEDS